MNRTGALIGGILSVGMLTAGCAPLTMGGDQQQDTEPTVTASATATPSSTPTITPTPTTTATSMPTNIPLSEPQRLEFESEDGTLLVGNYWPGTETPSPGVILMHQYRDSKEDWDKVVAALQSGPGYAVFAFDFRGHGESAGSMHDWEIMIGDANAALDLFASLPGVDPQRIVMIGSSIGADAAVDSCGAGCIGSISLSPGSFLDVPYNEALLALNDKPVLCAAGELDGNETRTCRDGVNVGLRDYQTQIYSDGHHHGMQMFNISDQSPVLIDLIIEWLAEHI